MEELLLKVEEVARVLGVGRSKAYLLVTSGQIPSVRFGRQFRVSSEALRGWVRKQEREHGVEAR